MTPPEQAMAARLTAIAELKDELRQAASQCLFEVQTETWYGAAGNLFGRAADGLATLSAHVETLEQDLEALKLPAKNYYAMLERAEQAEQQRDAAHAALSRYGQHDNGCGFYVKARCVCGLDAALAASAPQKKPEYETCSKCGVVRPCFIHDELAPAQETERGR